MSYPLKVFDERPENQRLPALERVDKMIDTAKRGMPKVPQFILCLLPEKKNCDVYGWNQILSFLCAF